jgi:hypothetical protein
MRWILRGAAALAIAWLLFLASPFVALHNFARAVEARDTAAVAERVNFRALRFSLMRQVANAYAQETGAGRALGAGERQLAIEAAMALAAPVVEGLLTPEAVIGLLNGVLPTSPPEGGAPPPESTETSTDVPVTVVQHLRVKSLGGAWRLILSAELRGFRNIFVSLPPDRPPDRQLRLRLRLVRTTWKLVNIELPPAMLKELARKLAAPRG